MPGWILMINEARRGLDCVGVPGGTSKQDRLKGNEVRRERRPGINTLRSACAPPAATPFAIAFPPLISEGRL
jgi:hypothetical protein